jgi:hypothetical protein
MTIDREAVAGAMIIGREAVDRILRATFGRDVPDIDHDKIAAKLSEITNLYHAGVTLRTAPAERRKQIKRAIEAAKWLKTEVEEIFGETEVFAPEPHQHSVALQRLIADLGGSSPHPTLETVEVNPPASWATLDRVFVKGFSEFEIVIHMLRKAFEIFFSRSAGYTRVEDADTQGQFVGFAKAALKELKISNATRKDGKIIRKPYSSRTIESAVTKLNKAAKAAR